LTITANTATSTTPKRAFRNVRIVKNGTNAAASTQKDTLFSQIMGIKDVVGEKHTTSQFFSAAKMTFCSQRELVSMDTANKNTFLEKKTVNGNKRIITCFEFYFWRDIFLEKSV